MHSRAASLFGRRDDSPLGQSQFHLPGLLDFVIQAVFVILAFVAVCLSITVIPPAHADDTADLKKTIEKLTARVEELERELGELKKRVPSDAGIETSAGRRNLYFEKLEKGLADMKNGKTPSAGCDQAEAIPAPDEKLSATLPREEVAAAEQDLPKTLSAARAVPYFRSGRAIGMRFFAIRDKSIYQHAGIKNGDIVMAVDGKRTCSPDAILTLPFLSAPAKPTSTLLLERNSRIIELKLRLDAGH